MADRGLIRFQFSIFALVSAAFTSIYITQPVLPVLQAEFGVGPALVSLSVSAVILGIGLSNLPFGMLADRYPVYPIILGGGIAIAAGGLICAITHQFWVLIAARFFQGLFVPALTTCLAAHIARTLPLEKLNVVMGSYVSATVLGGLGGRLLGGWIHPPLHWRYAFVSASALVLFAMLVALKELPRYRTVIRPQSAIGFVEIIRRPQLLLIFFCAAGGFAIFSSIFNYLPFRLSSSEFGLSTEMITLVYLVYLTGFFMGPLSGRISNFYGSGTTILAGTVVLGISLLLVLLPSLAAVISGLTGICAGFFTIHAAAVGSLNRKLEHGHGRANAIYVLFYYMGGWLGITGAGFAFKLGDWDAVVYVAILLLLIPAVTGLAERRYTGK